MKKNKYFIVDWDSSFFGFNIARINRESIRQKELAIILNDLKKKKYRLVYLYVSEKIFYSLAFFDMKFIYKKIKYAKNKLLYHEIDERIKRYEMPYPTEQMIDLAIESGIYSRFKLDENIDENKFNELYKKWIVNSVNKKFGQGVFIYEIDDKQAGLATFDQYQDTGKIGIIAVDKSYRRLNIASSLLNAAECYLFDAGCNVVTIVTQDCNKPACQLYEKNGYQIHDTAYVYHIWL